MDNISWACTLLTVPIGQEESQEGAEDEYHQGEGCHPGFRGQGGEARGDSDQVGI